MPESPSGVAQLAWRPASKRPGSGPAGSFIRAVGGPVHEDLVAVVDDPVEEGFGNDGVGEQRVPVLGCPVRGEHERSAGAFGDELIEVIGLGGGEFAHREVVQDQYGGPGELAEALVPGVVGVPAGEVREGAAGLEE